MKVFNVLWVPFFVSLFTVNANAYLKSTGIDTLGSQEIKKDTVVSDLMDKVQRTAQDSLKRHSPDLSIDSTKVLDTAHGLQDRVSQASDTAALIDVRDSVISRLHLYEDPMYHMPANMVLPKNDTYKDLERERYKQKVTANTKEELVQNTGQFDKAREEIVEYKNLYDSLVSALKIKGSSKTNSLKGQSLFRRIIIGGNFTIAGSFSLYGHSTFNINCSPTIGYRLNRVFEMGARSIYRSKLPADQCVSKAQEFGEVRGYGVFMSHTAFKGIFGHLEFERMNTTVENQANLESGWHEVFFVGIGRNWEATKWLELQTMLLYNVAYDNADGLYNSPVVFRSGFRLK
ncbi:hypothetical protein JMN32_03835 [Fulvivirga sp. 29W222]|uniref:Uncharacterized protein n=1 Tax=Fulvivirga marina TaxID=2494733 RepID=A0A937FVQ2_9BACT|nr:hypothetical protein [Fulvivirga marina]MBL6445422.1 hypothetical protein [Fulvivirga marina]